MRIRSSAAARPERVLGRPRLSLNGFGGGGGIGRAWPAGSPPAIQAWTSGRTGRGDSPTLPGSSSPPGSPARSIQITTDCAFRTTPIWPDDRADSPPHGRLRRPARSLARRLAGSAPTAPAGSTWRRAGRAQASSAGRRPVVRARERRGARGPRAGRPDRPQLLRQDRRSRAGGAGLAAARGGERHRSPGGQSGLQPVLRCPRRNGRGRDGRPARRRTLPGRDGAGYAAAELAWLRTHVADDDGSSRSTTSAATSRPSGCGALGPAMCWPPRPSRTSATRRSRCARHVTSRSVRRPCWRVGSATPGSSAGS